MTDANLLIVGSVGLDTLKTPFGSADRVAGGTAVFASTSASYLCKPAIVGVVGNDFPAEHEETLKSKGIDLTCLEHKEGRTFHWVGRYEGDMNAAITEDTQLGVFADFKPNIPASHQKLPYVFLGNIHPQLQLDVLDRVEGNPVVAADTMNLWIDITLDQLREVVSRVNIMLVNDGEAAMLTRKTNLLDAADAILAMGPKAVIIKKGSNGAMLFMEDEIFCVPAIPLKTAKDPTGAGDTFAGGMMGLLTRLNRFDFDSMKRAVVMGTVMASFTVEDFSLGRIGNVNPAEIKDRLDLVRKLTFYGDIDL